MQEQRIPESTSVQVAQRVRAVLDEVQSIIVGKEDVVEVLMIALLARGHALLEGIPGVAKTTICKAFAATLGCSFKRIQFTPDLLPADITGTYVLSPREGTFELREGPIFANLVLGDEINRASAKTQSALLEAMQEHQVTLEGETRTLPDPFMVLATQNPIELAGTYRLPEAQVDRFLIRLTVGYPTESQERSMLRRFTSAPPKPKTILTPDEIRHLQKLVASVHAEDEVLEYIVRLTTFTRAHPSLFLGASPRASIAMLQAARARALLQGRSFVLPDDVKSLATHVLAHRLVRTPEAEMEERSPESLIEEAMHTVPHRRKQG
ncbi:MAG: MoxR family ATPase [Myxococcota bacterium]